MLTSSQKHCLKGIGIRQWVNRSCIPLPASNEILEIQLQTVNSASISATASTQLPVQIPVSIPALVPVPVAEIIPKIEFNLDGWENINQSIVQCQNCKLANACTQKVIGLGNKQADLMIIGEPPGHDEDIKGEPFVGRPGVLFDKILQSIGISRSQVFITNIVKCRPPNNRDPHKDEVQACDAFLRAQIKQISPKVILSVGKVSAQSLLNTTDSVAKLITQNYQLPNSDIPLKVTYPPSYLLRNPTSKATVWQDMKWLQRVLNP